MRGYRGARAPLCQALLGGNAALAKQRLVVLGSVIGLGELPLTLARAQAD